MAAGCAAAVFVIAACSPVTHTRGNLALAEKIEAIKPGKQTREMIAEMLGSPSTTATFEKEDVWYYIGERTEAMAFLAPKVVERKIVVLHFDKQGIVQAVDELDGNKGKSVTPVDRVTPTRGKDLSVFEQIIGNVGRFQNPKGEGR